MALQKLSTCLVREPQTPDTLSVPTILSLGFVASGLCFFGMGLFTCLSKPIALLIYGVGFLLFFLFQLHQICLIWFLKQKKSIQVFFRTLVPWKKTTLFVVIIFAAAKSLALMRLGQHGDAYIYNVGLSDLWLRECRVGFQPTNIYSGYAYTIEHAYHGIRALVGDPVIHIYISQIAHAILGLTLIACSVLRLSRFSFWGALALTFIMMDATWTYIGFTAKNDLFAAGFSALALSTVFQRNKFNEFALAIAVIFAIKPNFFPVLMVAASAWFLLQDKKLSTRSLLGLIFLVLLSVISWLPFGINNAFLTSNPLIPLGSELFSSSFTPLQIPIGEYRPFSGSIIDYLKGLIRFFTRDGSTAYYSLLAFGYVAWRRQRQGYILLSMAIVLCFLTQLITRPFEIDHALRHYFASYFLLIAIAYQMLLQLFEKFSKRPLLCFVVLLTPIAAVSNWDRYIKDVIDVVKAPSAKEDLFQRKTMLGALDALSTHLDRTHLSHTVRLISFSNNLTAFSPRIEILTPGMSYPFYNWTQEMWDNENLIRNLKQMNIHYVMWNEKDSLDKVSQETLNQILCNYTLRYHGQVVCEI